MTQITMTAYGVPALTLRQMLVLERVLTSLDERGYPPTLREIGDDLGISSTHGVQDHLKALERKGYLVRAEEGKVRTLRVLRDTTGKPWMTKDEQIEQLQMEVETLKAELAVLKGGE